MVQEPEDNDQNDLYLHAKHNIILLLTITLVIAVMKMIMMMMIGLLEIIILGAQVVMTTTTMMTRFLRQPREGGAMVMLLATTTHLHLEEATPLKMEMILGTIPIETSKCRENLVPICLSILRSAFLDGV